MFAALKSAGEPVRYTEVPDAPHNCWDAAYRSDELHAWLFAQRLPNLLATETASRVQRRDEIAAFEIRTNERISDEEAGP